MGNIKDLIHQLPNVEEASGIGVCVPRPGRQEDTDNDSFNKLKGI